MSGPWQPTTLGQVIRLEYGKPLPPSARNPFGKFAVYGANGVKDRSDKCFCSKPSIIVGRKGSAGEVTLTEEGFWPLDVTYFVEFDRQRHDLKFLCYLLEKLDLPRLAKGVKPGINREEVYAQKVTVPPLPEQQRIVAILDEAFEGIATATANAEKNLANVDKAFDAYLSSVLHRLEGETEVTSLADVCNDLTVGHVGPMATAYKDVGIVFLRSQNVRPFEIDLNEAKFIDSDFDQKLRKSRLSPGDVVIVRTGYPGTTAVIPATLKAANCADLVIARPGPRLNPQYLAILLNSPFGKALVSGKLVGAAQKHFNVTAAKQARFPIPSLRKQEAIVEEASTARMEAASLKAIYDRKLVALAELKQSILTRAFSGALTAEEAIAAE